MSHDLPNRHTIRLQGYDYSQPGIYFVTICAQNREYLFGDIIDGKMILNETGKILTPIWESLPKRFPIILDEFQIMPNHVHMIIHIVGAGLVPAHNNPVHDFMPAHGKRATTRVAPTIGDIVGAYKSLITHEYILGVKNNGWKPFDKQLWQRNYYEHIVRTEEDLNKIREYVNINPLIWNRDRNNLKPNHGKEHHLAGFVHSPLQVSSLK